MLRLKTLLACAGLSSFTRRAVEPCSDFRPEPIRRPLDEGKSVEADDWLFDANEKSAHASAMDALTSSLMRLRETLSVISADAPILVEAEPVMSLGALSFDGDLFDGEPMLAGSEETATGMDAFLFEEPARAIIFDSNVDTDELFRQAA